MKQEVMVHKEEKKTIDDIKMILNGVLCSLFRDDYYLLEKEAKEETINFRLSMYLAPIFEEVKYDDSKISVDMEYNKIMDDEKFLQANGNIMFIRPDILVHERGSHNNNLIAIECKKRYIDAKDRLKLEKLLYSPYNYQFSIGISYLLEMSYFKIEIYTFADSRIDCAQYKFCKKKSVEYDWEFISKAIKN